MNYRTKDLNVLAYANGFTLWHYITPDTAEAVAEAGAWDAASDMLRTGDIILANVETDQRPGALMLLVGAVSPGKVATVAMAPAAQP